MRSDAANYKGWAASRARARDSRRGVRGPREGWAGEAAGRAAHLRGEMPGARAHRRAVWGRDTGPDGDSRLKGRLA